MTSLRLQFDLVDGVADGLPRFLDLVGSSLTRLLLDLPSGAELWLPRMLGACPSLKALAVHGDYIDTHSFLEAYLASELRIEELHLPFDDIRRLMTELEDKSTRLAHTLNRLEVFVDVQAVMDNGQDDPLKCTLSMLSVNTKLEFLQISMDYGWERSKRLADFEPYHNQALPAMGERFPVEFLSIFASSAGTGRRRRSKQAKSLSVSSPTLARISLDRHVLTHIFGFAASCARRYVNFAFYVA